MIRIPVDQAHYMLGKLVHIAWARPGRAWTLDKIEDDKAFLITPRTKKHLTVDLKDLCYTRLHEPKQQGDNDDTV